MSFRVRIFERGSKEGQRYRADKRLAEVLHLELARVRFLWGTLPVILPVAFSLDEAKALIDELGTLGHPSGLVEVPPGQLPACSVHLTLASSGACSRCSSELCLICVGEGKGFCPTCQKEFAKRRRNQRLRVTVLAVVLLVVCLFGLKELRRRDIDWAHPQRVAVVLVTHPGESLPPSLVERFKNRVPEVEAVFEREARRHFEMSSRPVALSVFGPAPEPEPPPEPPASDLLSLLRFNLALSGYSERCDAVAQVPERPFDVRLYVRARASEGEREAAEGLGQALGERGVVTAHFSESGTDFAWFVVMHEFLHTRGAKDKYGADGHALVPEGLADPEQEPLYPQERTEMMARGRPTGPGEEDLPGPVETWVVGEQTAGEIGWRKGHHFP